MRLQDLPPHYQAQARAQLDAMATRRPQPIPEPDQGPSLERQVSDPFLLVNPSRPLSVRLVRIGGRTLDGDNLAGGCKELRDSLAAALGRRGDSEADNLSWEYAQEPAGAEGPGMRVEVWDD